MIVKNKPQVKVIGCFETKAKANKNMRRMSFWIPSRNNKINVSKLKPAKIATFQRCLRTTLLWGQIFSLIPVSGITSDNAGNLKFVKTSWRSMYAILSIFGQFFMTLMTIVKVVYADTSLKSTTTVIFYGTTCITMIMFYQIGKSWPNLVQHISRTEDLDPSFDKKLTKKCKITCAVILILSLFEHILSLLSAFAGSLVCHSKKSTYEGFVFHFYPWVFNFIPYSPFTGAIIQFLHIQSTFIWNFSDLFVICMSYYLTSRLEHVNRKLIAAQGKYHPEVFWKTTREDYCRATALVRRVDDVISGVVFISFANNLFFICFQLFNTLEDGVRGKGECRSKDMLLGGYESPTYFMFSLVYLISRSIAVSLIASQVNTASAVPAPILYEVPSPVYCTEVQRFIEQVNGDNVALSGLQFFSVTKGLLLSVAGTIVTYELVMFQFNSSPSTTSNATALLPNVSTTTH